MSFDDGGGQSMERTRHHAAEAGRQARFYEDLKWQIDQAISKFGKPDGNKHVDIRQHLIQARDLAEIEKQAAKGKQARHEESWLLRRMQAPDYEGRLDRAILRDN